MDVLELIDELHDLVHSAKPVPLRDQVRVDKAKIYDILDRTRSTIPEELKQARWTVKERDEMLAAAKHEAERIIKQARERQTQLVAQHERIRHAEARPRTSSRTHGPESGTSASAPRTMPTSSSSPSRSTSRSSSPPPSTAASACTAPTTPPRSANAAAIARRTTPAVARTVSPIQLTAGTRPVRGLNPPAASCEDSLRTLKSRQEPKPGNQSAAISRSPAPLASRARLPSR
jgi:hypothetical protein